MRRPPDRATICRRCGKTETHIPGARSCPVPDDVVAALGRFRDRHGKPWKIKLVSYWLMQHPSYGIVDWAETARLNQARDLIGPIRLYKIKV